MTEFKVYTQNCLSKLASMEPDSVDCIWTDPPYLLSNGGVTCVNGRMVSVDKGDWDSSRGLDADFQFNKDWLAAAWRVLKPGGSIWVSGSYHVYFSVGMAMREIGFRVLNDIIWEKPNPPPNLGIRCFTHSTELLIWACKPVSKKASGHTFNYYDLKEENGGKQMKNVWRFTAPGKSEKVHGKHPTQKPVALIRRSLRASTNSGDLVLDPFCGSGSTGVAALLEGRRFVGVEADKQYAHLARKRLKGVSDESSS